MQKVSESRILADQLGESAMLAAALAEPVASHESERDDPLARCRLSGHTLWARIGRVAVLAIADTAVLVGVGALAVMFWAVRERGQPLSLYVELLPLVALFVLGYAKAGLYPGFGLGAVETLRRVTLRTSFIFLILAASSFALKLPGLYSRMTAVLAWIFALVALPVVRWGVLSLVTRLRWWAEPAVVVGASPLAREGIQALRQALTLGYKPVMLLSSDANTGESFEGLPVVGSLARVEEVAARGVRVALVTGETTDRWSRLVRRLEPLFGHVIVLRPGLALPLEGAQVRNLGGLLGIEFRNELLRRHNRAIKRGLDLVVGSLALIVSAPICAAAAIFIKIVDRGPAFFSHEREGPGGRRFRIWKLRTMYRDAEQRLEALLEADREARREWEERFKLTDDPRLIPGGRLLRRFSIDELPQFWSVIKGDMSLVGPRPFPEYHLRRFDDAFRELRRRVRPGLSGLWQVTVRSSGSIHEQQYYDSYYIRNWSLWLDIYICGRTLHAVLSGKDAF